MIMSIKTEKKKESRLANVGKAVVAVAGLAAVVFREINKSQNKG